MFCVWFFSNLVEWVEWRNWCEDVEAHLASLQLPVPHGKNHKGGYGHQVKPSSHPMMRLMTACQSLVQNLGPCSRDREVKTTTMSLMLQGMSTSHTYWLILENYTKGVRAIIGPSMSPLRKAEARRVKDTNIAAEMSSAGKRNLDMVEVKNLCLRYLRASSI